MPQSVRSRGLCHTLSHLAVTVVAFLAVALAATPTAGAHSELLQSSPRSGATVGGSFHQVALQFGGLAEGPAHDLSLVDPAGNEITTIAVQEGQRVVLPIEPLAVPGMYTVRYAVVGADGDNTSGSFTFRFDPAADEPLALTIGNTSDPGFDFIAFGLLLAGAAVLGFLVYRFSSALRDHRAASV